jgi:lysophospholipase L1-like esterase
MYKLLSVFILSLISYALPNQKPIVVYIIGDSTAANKTPNAFPETGWGMEFGSYFNEKVQVDNRAMNGRSTKSFINEKRWDTILTTLKQGDYVLIQFGHNDEKIDKPGVGTSLAEYKANLIKFVQETQAKKAKPILLTPIMRRSFKDGVFVDTHQGYPYIVRKLADSLQVPLIDMHRKTEKLIVDLGERSSKGIFNHVDVGHVNYPDGKKDDTHLSPVGAKMVANLVIEGINKLYIPLGKHVKKFGKIAQRQF